MNLVEQGHDKKMMLDDAVKENYGDKIPDNTTIKIDNQIVLREEIKIEETKKIENNKNEIFDINELEKITVSNDLDKVKVIVNLPIYVLKKFKENIFKKYGLELNLNIELESIIGKYIDNFGPQHHPTSSLCFDGKEPRKDVLLKLQKITHELKGSDQFPMFYRHDIETTLKVILGNVDPRTFKKYFLCIREFVEKTTGQKLGYYGVYNMNGFEEVILEKLTILESKGNGMVKIQ
ncbi:MAG TPA: hypothetical protein VND01_00680 [Candidatus Acidoferrales bacterium]|nr:hypothetical protein [Candidatus Acidoferrales bacterium]